MNDSGVDTGRASRPKCCKPACTFDAVKVVRVVLPAGETEYEFCARHGREFLGGLYDLVGDKGTVRVERREQGKGERGQEAVEEVKTLFPGAGRVYR